LSNFKVYPSRNFNFILKTGRSKIVFLFGLIRGETLACF